MLDGGETPWLKELEEEFREVRQETLKRIKDKEERKLKNEAGKEAGSNGVEKEKELVTPTDIPKEESLIEAQKDKKPLPPVNDEDEVNGVYQWYDAIDHTVGESQGPVVEHLYEEVGGKSLGRDEIVKHPLTVPRKGRRREFRRIGTSDGRGGAAMTGVGAGGPMGQVERESGRVGGLSSVEEGEGSYGTNSTQRRSGFFSFLRWFKKGKEEHTECNKDCEKEEVEKEEEFDEVLDLPASPRLHSKFGTWSSVDTLASTSSFAFVQPTDYLNRRVNHVELGIEPGPDTDTYRHRLKIRERSRHLDQDLTLRRKYRLHDFEVEPTPEQKRKILQLPGDVIEDEEEEGEDVGIPTLGKRSNSTSRKGTVSSHTSSFGRKKRRAPLPPGFDLSLPNTLEHPSKSGEKTGCGSQNSRHRRSASESRTRSGYCHVKGKRRAPPPPKSHSPAFSPTVALPEPSRGPKTQSVSVSCTPPTSPRYGSFGKRKRAAPPPPVNVSVREDKEVQAADGLMSGRGEGSHLSPEERRRLIANIVMLRAHAEKGKISMGNTRGMVSPPGSPRTGEGQAQSVRHDYLRIEKGQLLTTVEKVNEGVMGNSASEQKATLSPRPWYKRKSVLRDSPSSSKKDSFHSPTPSFFKSLEKRKPWKKKEGDEAGGLGDDEEDDDWMPEVGYRRPGGIFSATSSTEVTIKHEEEEVSGDDHTEQIKRRSQVISMLANISELDREAAAIVNEERKKEREVASAEDEKFYAEPELPPVLAAAWSGGVAIPAAPTASTSNNEENQSLQPKGNAKHLISLFNSISGVSNVSSSSENKVTSFISVLKEDVIEEQVSEEEEAERKRSTAETVQALVLDANRARLNGRRNIGRNGNNSSGGDKIEVGAGNSVNSEVENSESKSEEASGPAKEDPPQVWVCTRCTLENPKWRLTCDACNMWRPSGGWQGRRGSGDSEVKNKVENLEKENASKGSSKSSGSNINWEAELKKYFPNQDPMKGESKTVIASKTNDTKESEMPDKASVSTVGLKDDKSQEKAVASPSNVPAVQKKFVVPNFIGGVGVKQKIESSKEKPVIERIGNCIEKDEKDMKADLYEVRKARLAFFSVDREESQEKPNAKEVEFGESPSSPKSCNKMEKKEAHEKKAIEKNTSPTTANVNHDGSLEAKKKVNQKPASVSVDTLSKSKQNIDGEEKQKLRDMLKEMKNSLPHSHRSKGAIKKVITDARSIVEEVPPPPPQRSDSAVEAYLITTETVYENIKIRPQPLPPGTKVSSSAQTSSAIVRKVTPSKALLLNSSSVEKAPYPSSPSAPSLSTINKGEALIKDGILYTSLKRKVIGAGTFELIQAGDFASIEATKTGGSGGPVHLYANLPPPGRVRASGAIRQVQKSSEGIPPAGPFPSRQQEISGKNADQGRAVAVKAETPLPPTSSPNLPDNSKEVDEAKAEEDRLTAQLTLPKGLAKFKGRGEDALLCGASLVHEEEGNLTDLEASGRLNPDTLAVARLLRRLEAAIAGGQHESAAVLARQLARLKINCSVTRHANNRRSLMGSPRESSVEGGPSSAASSTSGSTKITIDMYVEDKVSHLGPIPVVVSTSMTVKELKTRVEQDFEIPVNVQRWIIGRRLASDDSLTLLQHDVTSNGTPVFLYLVAPGEHNIKVSNSCSPNQLDHISFAHFATSLIPRAWYDSGFMCYKV
ncbi:hypothetical protein J437_LFUL013166 [Ladona fulva]|uniref:RanBP-type and C3HC4-type zinc finger-containing protein 1 n=1 Tax=Ladona fulva TaxID=123851 RepID=A0A8K0KDY4_LADFU|nr:hypothetical protein J437_LFUL013166 [Ladona fulva]